MQKRLFRKAFSATFSKDFKEGTGCAAALLAEMALRTQRATNGRPYNAVWFDLVGASSARPISAIYNK